MKALILASVLLTASFAQADTLVCAIKENANPKNYSSVTVDLENIEEGGYNDDKGIAIGENAYSFGLIVEKGEDKHDYSINAVFYENLHVQDEVASMSWDINVYRSKAGVPVINEPLEEDDKVVFDFVCYHNK